MNFVLHYFIPNFFLNIHSLDCVYSIKSDVFRFYSFIQREFTGNLLRTMQSLGMHFISHSSDSL